MRYWKLFSCMFTLLCSLHIPTYSVASEQIIDGPIAREHLQRTVKKMLYQEKFAELEIMAGEFRKTKARFPDGVWKLENFYIGLTSPFEKSADGWKRHLSKMDKWLQKLPNSITAKVAAGETWFSFGMYARGGGYADTVSDDSWRLLKERIQKAYSLLMDKPANGEDDCAVRYELLLSIAKVEGWPRLQFEKIFNEAISFEPSYANYYLRKAEYLQPRWYGEEGEWQQFAQQAVKLFPDKEGKSIYTRILWPMWKYQKEFTTFNAPGISWPLMKQGFIDADKRFPGSPWLLNSFCKFACMAGDMETARELFKRIDNYPYVEAWDERAEFEKWQDWAFPPDERVVKAKQKNKFGESEDRRQMLKLAEEGDIEAQNRVGALYGNWLHGTPDKAISRKWFQKAAELGHPEAQYNYSRYVMSGKNPSKKESEKWLYQAAIQGSENAAAALGSIFKFAKGPERNLIKSYAWYSQLTTRHDNNLDEIVSSLSIEELKQAEIEASKLRNEIQSNKIAAEYK